MSDNLDELKDLYMFQIVLPGSHDSGMSVKKYVPKSMTTFGFPSTTVTQRLSVYEQLEQGVRVLDIRPFVKNTLMLNGHYTKVDVLDQIPFSGTSVWQGACGESIVSVVEAVNDFTAKYNEFIVVQISDWSGFDGERDYDPFTADQWKELWVHLSHLDHRYIAPDKNKIIRDDKLGTYLQKGKPAVIIVVDQSRGAEILDEMHGQGFYKGSQWFPKDMQFWYSAEMPKQDYVKYTIMGMSRDIATFGDWEYPLIDRADACLNDKNPNMELQLRENKPARIPFDLYLRSCVLWADGIDSAKFASKCWQFTMDTAKAVKEYKYTT